MRPWFDISTEIMEKGDFLEARKLRKKLRQIEHLERLSRPLNQEEVDKVSRKAEFREKLQRILSQLPLSDKGQDTIPTALLIHDIENLPSSPSVEDQQGALNLNEIYELGQTEKVSEESMKRQLDKSASGPSASNSSPPPSPKRLKKSKSRDERTSTVKVGKRETDVTDLQKIWRTSKFSVRTLKGHNDIISAVAADGNLILSASRDTTVKVWNAETEDVAFSLRGHKGSITCLVLLGKSDSDELSRYLGLATSHRLALSGAYDSTIILWSVTSGEMKKSIYTFNTVTCAAYVQPEVCFITATDGGKLQIWDAVSGTMLRSLTAYDDAYTCISAVENYLYTASSEGIIKIWDVTDRDLKEKFSMDDLELPTGTEIILRTVHCIETYKEWVFYGDDGPNVKAFNWKTGEIMKFRNHTCEWGSSDSIVCTGQELISSSYNLDEAKGHMNVRLFPSGQYVCSLNDGQTGRIYSLAHTMNGDGNLRLVTGGLELKIWDILQAPHCGRRDVQCDGPLLEPTYIPYYDKEADQSEYDSSDVDTDFEDSDCTDGPYEKTYIPIEVTNSPSIWSYCSIL